MNTRLSSAAGFNWIYILRFGSYFIHRSDCETCSLLVHRFFFCDLAFTAWCYYMVMSSARKGAFISQKYSSLLLFFFSFITLGTRNMRLFLYTQLANWAKRMSRKIPSFWLTYDTTFGSVRMELGSGVRTVFQISTNFNGCHSTKMSHFDFLDSLQTPHLSSQDSADANIFPRVEFYYKFEILLIKCHATPYRASCSSFQNSICQLVYIVCIVWPHSIMGL